MADFIVFHVSRHFFVVFYLPGSPYAKIHSCLYTMQFFSHTNIGQGLLFSLAITLYGGLSARCTKDESHLVEVDARQAPAITATDKFLRRGNHASAVAGHYLYIDGGDFSFINNGRTVYDYCKYLQRQVQVL